MEIELNKKEIYNIWETLIVANIKKEKQIKIFNTTRKFDIDLRKKLKKEIKTNEKIIQKLKA